MAEAYYCQARAELPYHGSQINKLIKSASNSRLTNLLIETRNSRLINGLIVPEMGD